MPEDRHIETDKNQNLDNRFFNLSKALENFC